MNENPLIYKVTRSVYLIVTVALGVLGIYLNANENGLNVFTYYTIQSNTICILVSLLFLWQLFFLPKVSTVLLSAIQGGSVMCIMLTFLVFHFLLLPTITGDLAEGNIYVHYVVPLMMLGDYIIFKEKGTLKFRWIFLWALVPIAYCIFVFIYSGIGGRFGAKFDLVPYFFLDYTRFGIGGVVLWILALALAYIGLSASLVLVDRFLAKIIKG